jgi:hypothetical protein
LKVHRRLLKRVWTGWAAALLVGAAGWSLAVAEGLTWRADRRQLDAEVERAPLAHVLELLASSTGWEVFVEDQIEQRVTTRFSNLPPAEALPRLLGDLNFALQSSSNAPTRLYVYRTSRDHATQLITPPKAAQPRLTVKAIGNELIVMLKPDAKETIEQLAKRLGAKVVGRMDDLRAYRLQFEDDTAAAQARGELATNDSVDSVDLNYVLEPPSRIQPLPGAGSPPLSLKPATVGKSDYVVVGLVDTPVNADKSTAKAFLLPGVAVAGTTAPTDQLTHGTAMAETILQGLALTPQDSAGSKVRILPVDVYGSGDSTTTFDVARGLAAAAEGGAKVINLSLGSYSDSPLLHQLIQDLTKQGTVIVASAGNDHVTAPVYPAAYPEVVSVTASDRTGNIAPYANYGSWVKTVAPGDSVVWFDGQSYLVTGTSPAAAFTSGQKAGQMAPSGAGAAAAAQPPAPARTGSR